MVNMAASLAISIPTHLSSSSSSSSSTASKSKTHLPYPTRHPQISSIGFFISISQLGSSWNGLRYASLTVSRQLIGKDKRRRKCGHKVVHASLFGVGAPEALVIGVVALLVFGPKGLAEVARTLGKTLRAFQPTIRELQDVSREFKSTLEREIGLDDIANPAQNIYTSSSTTRTPTTTSPSPASSTDTLQTPIDSNGALSTNQAYSTEEYLKVKEEQLKAAAAVAAQQQGQATSDELVPPENQSQSTKVQEPASATTPAAKLESDAS
uniref:Sec-independent protein translocase protein TATB, chloroplastic n=1 Tax=Kalanchoe fedtschenkoi TaxID=63787 RepID=A0A7N0U485_KALFE